MDCIVVDVDGTVADCNHRRHLYKKGAAFFADVHLDTPITTVITVVQAIRDTGVVLVFLSARDEMCRQATSAWLAKNVGEYGRLYMRRSGDRRIDRQVKTELLAELRSDNYQPILMIDDRNAVVDLWREYDLPVWHVVPRAKRYIDGSEDTRYDHGDF